MGRVGGTASDAGTLGAGLLGASLMLGCAWMAAMGWMVVDVLR